MTLSHNFFICISTENLIDIILLRNIYTLDHPFMPLVHEAVDPLLHDVSPKPLYTCFHLIFRVDTSSQPTRILTEGTTKRLLGLDLDCKGCG